MMFKKYQKKIFMLGFDDADQTVVLRGLLEDGFRLDPIP